MNSRPLPRIMSRDGLEFIKRLEGLKLTAYKDTGGIWTIGFGSTRGVVEGMTITEKQAHMRLLDDLDKAEHAVDKYVRVNVTKNQCDALISFAFNTGDVAFLNSTLLRVLNDGNYASVPNEMMRWVHDRSKKVVQGLVNRRKAEVDLWNTPEVVGDKDA